MSRPVGSAKVLEQRRWRALRLLDKGYSLNEVGRMVGCAPSSVMRWRDTRRRKGKQGLKVRSSPGRPPKLGAGERRRLIRLLLKGARAHGYRTELWTTVRIAELVEREFGVSYHRDHVGRLMRNLGWSHQKPKRRAVERNEGVIDEWKREQWPRVKKTPLGWVPT